MTGGEKSPPAAALAELRAYLRIEDGLEDALLAGLLRAATETVEAMLGQLLFEREVEERRTAGAGPILLRREPVKALVAAELIAADGGRRLLELDALRLVLDEGRGAVELPGDAGGEVLLRYRAGLAAGWNGVPELFRLCVIRVAAHFHAHRDAAEDPGLPPAVRRLLAPWRTRRLG